MQVFVLDSNRQPLDPCSPARARILLARGRAVVFRRYPFTILLKDRTLTQSVVHPQRLKIDPGARTTGMALVQEPTGRVLAALEITHRGPKIQAALVARRALRRNRRNRKTRYRPSRFANRRRRPGWLPPSLESRLANVQTWVERLRRLCPITALSQELIKFDLQALENPEISGVEYQQGTLAGYELREYLLEKWGRTCAYCGKTGVPLQMLVAACGHGCRQQCRTDRHGFPIRHKPRAKRCPRGFCTGDIGRAVVPAGKYQGVHTGRLAIRFQGYHQVGTVPINPAWIKTIHRADGYWYAMGVPFHLPAAGGAAPPHA